MNEDYFFEDGHYIDEEDRIAIQVFDTIIAFRNGTTVDELSEIHPRDWIIEILKKNRDI